VQEVLQLQPRLASWRQNGFELVIVSADPPEELRAFLARHPVDAVVLMDRSRAVGRLYGVRGIPADFLVDGEGVVRHSFVGWDQDFLESIEKWVVKN
jgi:peroxiredoxin